MLFRSSMPRLNYNRLISGFLLNSIMEKDLLLYLLYNALILIRSRSSEKDSINFEISNILHNVPLQLISGESDKEIYKKLLHNAKGEFIEKWLKMVQDEFFKTHPEYQISN